MEKDMCRVEGGEFAMGSADFYPEERPVHRVRVDGFWMDDHPVTVAEFRRFVKATGHVTVAERTPDPADFPDADPEQLVPGSLVFRKPPGPVPLDDVRGWWQWTPGADWRHPYGPESNLDGLDRHPATHVAYDDAAAYAAWAGKALPSEAEWEYAARGGLDGAVFAWGDDAMPKGRPMANTWQGRFPWENLRVDGYEGTSPIKAFPPNRYGLYDMTGNVWEWTDDFFTAHANATANPCCVPHNPRHHTPDPTVGAGAPGAHLPRRVIKGGSHLCAPNYCLRYRPAARQAETVDTSTCHIGFRCIIRDAPGA
jgi:formylglycine-generating enzyme required for sulfatase activity